MRFRSNIESCKVLTAIASIVSFQRLPAVNIPSAISIMVNVNVLLDTEETTAWLLSVARWQMEMTDLCDKATTANAMKVGLASIAMSANLTRLATS